MIGMTFAEYRAAIERRPFVMTGTFRRSEDAIARSKAVRVAHGYTVELPAGYDPLGAQRNARLARLAASKKS